MRTGLSDMMRSKLQDSGEARRRDHPMPLVWQSRRLAGVVT
jgi:hypothetical protein